MALIGVYETYRGTLLYNMLSQRAHIFETISSYSHKRGGSLRAAGSMGEATSFGIFLCTTFVATLSLTDMFRNKKCWLIALAVIFAGFYAANTRAALVGLVVGLLAFDIFRKKYGRLFRNVAIIAAVTLSALVVAQFSYRMSARLGIASETSSTSDYRKQLFTRGWEEIRKHPWIGIDPPKVIVALADLRQGEGFIDFVNAYIWYGMTAGVPGMILLFLGFMLMPVRLTVIRRRLGSMIYAREMGASIFAISLFYGLSAGTSGFGGRTAMIVYLYLAAGAALCAMRAPRIAADPATDERMPLVHAPA
jgi:O-antigen ligase